MFTFLHPFYVSTFTMMMIFQGKCITLSSWNRGISGWHRADKACRLKGDHCATFKTRKEFESLQYLHSKASNSMFAYVGLKSNRSGGNLYRYIYVLCLVFVILYVTLSQIDQAKRYTGHTYDIFGFVLYYMLPLR